MPLGARATVVCVEEPFVDIVLDSKIVSGNKLVCLCLCLCVHTYIHTYIHTHTHIHTYTYA